MKKAGNFGWDAEIDGLRYLLENLGDFYYIAKLSRLKGVYLNGDLQQIATRLWIRTALDENGRQDPRKPGEKRSISPVRHAG